MRQIITHFLHKNLYATLFFVLVSNFLTAQQEISGTVSEKNGPFPGATVWSCSAAPWDPIFEDLCIDTGIPGIHRNDAVRCF